jgi:dihydrofolate reductase
MSKVFSALAVSVDGYISGRDPSDAEGGYGRGLGDAGMLFDWYFTGDTPSTVFSGFRLSGPSVQYFDELAGRVGAAVAGRGTYDHSSGFGGGSPHPTAPLFVVSHRSIPSLGERQTLCGGIEEAIAGAREAAGERDVALMGGGVVSSALAAGLVDELILHQVPVLLGGGRSFFQELPGAVRLQLRSALPAPGVTHLHYEVVR